jgi:hypothetical protein
VATTERRLHDLVNLSKDLRPSLENMESRSSVGIVGRVGGMLGGISCVVVDVDMFFGSRKMQNGSIG